MLIGFSAEEMFEEEDDPEAAFDERDPAFNPPQAHSIISSVSEYVNTSTITGTLSRETEEHSQQPLTRTFGNDSNIYQFYGEINVLLSQKLLY